MKNRRCQRSPPLSLCIFPGLRFTKKIFWGQPEFLNPGVVSREQHEEALRRYPDPRMVLGPLYDGDGFGLEA